jgi:L-ascorbate metabolism protein UlaG (beta-lactamase superfamily)
MPGLLRANRLWCLIAAVLGMLAALPAGAQDRIPSHCQALAEATGGEYLHLASVGTPVAANRVRISYIDHAMFMIETPGGLRAVTDYSGFIGSTPIVPDVVTMNNAHSTHWTATPDPRIPHVLQGWATGGLPANHQLDLGEMLVRNVPTDVRSRWGAGVRPNGNSIFIFEAAGLCIGHLGHLHHEPDDSQYAAIGRLDVVMVPVDGGYTLDLPTMMSIVGRLRSSVVIPMHWFSSTALNAFLAGMAPEFDVVRLDQNDIELGLRDLPGRPTILQLQPAFLR